MTDLAKMNRTQRRNYHYMADALRRFEWDIHYTIEATDRIPLEWHEIARQRAPQRKVKVTLALEEDVVRFFKSMGTGHGARMNEVLRVFMHGRIAGVIRGPETVDYYRRREALADAQKPWWGQTDRDLKNAPELTEEEQREARIEMLRMKMRLGRLEE
jgi:uncharacterized protein (DUF4415 family)